MSLDKKSKENIELVDFLINKDRNFWNALAGKPYYAVFQKVKHFLKSKHYNYDSFLKKFNENRLPKEKKIEHTYAHRTIHLALVDFMRQNKIGFGFKEMKTINCIEELYFFRWRADYTEDVIRKSDVEDKLRKAKEVIEIVEEMA